MRILSAIADRGRWAWRFTRATNSLASRSTPSLTLRYPRGAWYQENAAEMLVTLDDLAARLERALGLRLPTGACCSVVDPETARAVQGTTGAAYAREVLIGIRPGPLAAEALRDASCVDARTLRATPA